MNEKYYVVSEGELNKLVAMAIRSERVGGQVSEANLEHAEVACRVREVPESATHFVQNLDGPLDYGLYSIEKD